MMLWGQWALIGWEGSWYSLRSSCKVHIIMRHYLGYSFIWLALQKSASPDCWYVKPVAHRLEKNVENNFSANTGPGEPKNSIKKNNNAENTSGKNLLVAVSSEKGKIASVKVNWPQYWCCSQPGTGQFCNWATYYLIKSFDSKSFKIAAIISVLLSWY